MKIGRVVLVPVFLLVMAGAGLAASYEMLLSQNDKLCTTLLNLINDDLKRYGTIRYDTHDMFAAIKWKPLSEKLGEKFKDSSCSMDYIAEFDLNNDGHIDIVVIDRPP